MNSALVECFSDLKLEQDRVTIHILGNGSAQPISVARVASDTYVASTNPNMVRMGSAWQPGALRPASPILAYGRRRAG